MTDYVAAQTQEWAAYTEAYRGRESVSGPGSTLAFTAPLRAWLPAILKRHTIHSILDAGCGDFSWLSRVNLDGITYEGWDAQLDIVKRNSAIYPHLFRCVNLLTVEQFPKVDLIIARDIFIHLPNDYVIKMLDKMTCVGSRLLLATNFPQADNTTAELYDAEGFYYRPTDLETAPFWLNRVDQVAEPGREPGREMLLCAL